MRILVLGPSWLGDVVMAIPTYRALRARFPDARIGVLARASVAGLYPLIGGFDRVFEYRRPGSAARFLPYWRIVRELREFGPDLALVLPRSFGAAWTALLSGAPRRIGFATSGRGALLTEAVARSPHLRGHRADLYRALLAPLDAVGPKAAPDLEVSPALAARAAELMAPLAGEGPLVAFVAGASYGVAKQWPEERFAALGRLLLERRDARLVLVGGPGDREACRRVAERMGGGARVLDLAGRTSVAELAGVLSACDLVVANDTGAMHVAQAVGAPIVALFGPTDPITTSPYGDAHALIREPVECAPCLRRTCPIDHRCMTRIEPERVLAACEAMLAAS